MGAFLQRARRCFRPQRATASSELLRLQAQQRLAGKRVLVTGACSGLGFEVSKALLQDAGVRSILFHGRSTERISEAIATLPQDVQTKCEPIVADMARLKDVDAMARSLQDAPPDVIVCCAGVATLPERTLTCDGYEMQFAINYLSHFHLVKSLLPKLKSGTRIVMVSSDLHGLKPSWLAVDMADLNSEKSYSFLGTYLKSKYCMVLLGRALAARGITCVSATPGATATDIDRHLSPALRFCFRYLGPGLFSKTPEEGAASIAFCAGADDSDVSPGAYYDADSKVQLPGGLPYSLQDTLPKELWNASEKLVDAALSTSDS
eukprot:TRINITY_DN7229_c0_g1_i1.p1 TRINITY_DN7229_c0_g1~~TRINITY_DN7229_c0_g1_i1.p1  ORF type:complete len:320 (+),score=76.39 TRINITY_DN7229_c0_g1_i1:67-1026(+)